MLATVQPSKHFVCTYTGNSSQNLEINKAAIGRFSRFSALDGRILLKDGNFNRSHTTHDVNSDGSVTGKRGLHFGKESWNEDRFTTGFMRVEQDPEGWNIALNGQTISEALMVKKGLGVREIEKGFALIADQAVKDGLRESLLRDKCTLTGDPFLFGRLSFSAAIFLTYLQIARGQADPIHIFFAGLLLLGMGYTNVIEGKETKEIFYRAKRDRTVPHEESFCKYMTPARRSTSNIPEGLSLPFEIDRLLVGLGYLAWLDCRSNSLVRLNKNSR